MPYISVVSSSCQIPLAAAFTCVYLQSYEIMRFRKNVKKNHVLPYQNTLHGL
ncbi:hypothetical protein RRG08_048300 [Elysia crispata]|uniref:Uncharacterized protein n=1 Tax=Elysia crispata TaxID=231223 RepID=A0AAE0ZTE3_9GAST|nr:hypothetical protein RRG08_048300 [Elysia crispata]